MGLVIDSSHAEGEEFEDIFAQIGREKYRMFMRPAVRFRGQSKDLPQVSPAKQRTKMATR